MNIPSGETIRVRLPEELMATLRRAAQHYGLDYSTIAEKALYAVRKHRPDLDAVEIGSTYGGEAVRLCIAAHLWPDDAQESRADRLRRALAWHLSRQSFAPQLPPCDPEQPRGDDG